MKGLLVGCFLAVSTLTLQADPDPVYIWKMLDSEIGNMEQILAQKKGTILSGENYGSTISPEKDALEQYMAQTDLLKEIRASGNAKVARQYLVVYHLMSEKSLAATLASGKLDPENTKYAQNGAEMHRAALKFLQYVPPKWER